MSLGPKASPNTAVQPQDGPESCVHSGLDEAGTLLAIISESISSLFRLGVLMSKPSAPDPFNSAARLPYTLTLAWQSPRVLERRFWQAAAKRRQFIINNLREADARKSQESQVLLASAYLQEQSSTPSGIRFSQIRSDRGPSHKQPHNDMTSRPTLPPLADLSEPGQPFKCPICFTAPSFLDDSSWRSDHPVISGINSCGPANSRGT